MRFGVLGEPTGYTSIAYQQLGNLCGDSRNTTLRIPGCSRVVLLVHRRAPNTTVPRAYLGFYRRVFTRVDRV